MSRLRAFAADVQWVPLLGGYSELWIIFWAIFLDSRFQPKMERLIAGGYNAVYIVMPLAMLSALHARRARGLVVALACVTTLLVSGPLLYHWARGANRNWALADPEAFLWPIGVAACLSAASAVIGQLELARFGLGKGDFAWWAPKVGVAAAVMVSFAVAAVALVPQLQEFYPSDARARSSIAQLLLGQLLRGLVLAGEEAFFHGIALFAISRSHGPRAAVLATSLMYFFMHRYKPEAEMASSLIGALLLGVACLRAGTFWPALLVHWPMNLAVELAAYLMAGPRTDQLNKLYQG